MRAQDLAGARLRLPEHPPRTPAPGHTGELGPEGLLQGAGASGPSLAGTLASTSAAFASRALATGALAPEGRLQAAGICGPRRHSGLGEDPGQHLGCLCFQSTCTRPPARCWPRTCCTCPQPRPLPRRDCGDKAAGAACGGAGWAGGGERGAEATAGGFGPLRAEPAGLRIHLLNRSATVCCQSAGPLCRRGDGCVGVGVCKKASAPESCPRGPMVWRCVGLCVCVWATWQTEHTRAPV